MESFLDRAVSDQQSGSEPDESAIRDMAILIAIEVAIKLLETSIPGGVTLSKGFVEDAAHAAIARVELVGSRLYEMRDR